MIIDKLSNSDIYTQNEDLKAAFTYLKSLNKFPKEEGKVEICGERIFANIAKYQTKDKTECKIEAHRNYIDIQVLFSGRENIAWHPVSELVENIPYNEESDVGFYTPPKHMAGQGTLSKGTFMLLFPDDAHMPQIAVDDIPETVEKIVIKIMVE